MEHDRLCGLNFDAECTCHEKGAKGSLSASNGLLPCPFCGGEAETDENSYNSVKPNDWDAYCDNCLIGFTRKTENLAIKAWNRRAG